MKRIATAVMAIAVITMAITLIGCATTKDLSDMRKLVDTLEDKTMRSDVRIIENQAGLMALKTTAAKDRQTVEANQLAIGNLEIAATRTHKAVEINQAAILVNQKAISKIDGRVSTNRATMNNIINHAMPENQKAIKKLRAAVNREVRRVSGFEDQVPLKNTLIAFRIKGFAPGKSELTENLKKLLGTTAKAIQDEGRTIVEIHGYADPLGKAEKNLELSQERADTAKKYLTGLKLIEADKAPAVGKGETLKYGVIDEKGENRCVVIIAEKRTTPPATPPATPTTP